MLLKLLYYNNLGKDLFGPVLRCPIAHTLCAQKQPALAKHYKTLQRTTVSVTLEITGSWKTVRQKTYACWSDSTLRLAEADSGSRTSLRV